MLYIILASVFYTSAIILGTVASRSANTNLVTTVINIVSVFIPIAVVAPILSKKLLIDSKFGILMAFLTGIAIALFTMALTKSYSENKVAIVAPIVFGGAIFLSTILSYLFFKEKITPFQGAGLLFLGIGLLLVIFARITGR
jgi:uncharacterized membrane protein